MLLKLDFFKSFNEPIQKKYTCKKDCLESGIILQVTSVVPWNDTDAWEFKKGIQTHNLAHFHDYSKVTLLAINLSNNSKDHLRVSKSPNQKKQEIY